MKHLARSPLLDLLEHLRSQEFTELYRQRLAPDEVLKPKNKATAGFLSEVLRQINQTIYSQIKSEGNELAEVPARLERAITSFSKMSVGQELEQYRDSLHDKLTTKAKEEGIGEVSVDRFILGDLFSLPFFHPLLNGILQSQNVDVKSESLFSNFSKRDCSACGKSGPTKDHDRPACKFCSSHMFIFSPNSIQLMRNVKQHQNMTSGVNQRAQILEHYEQNLGLFKSLSNLTIVKLISTMYHLVGASKWLWEVPPKSIQEIWDDFPIDVSKNEMQETLKLLKQNSSFGQENYVDLKGRKNYLIRELKNGKIVTIYGEGGLGKTELVYQSLDEIVESGDFKFDCLVAHTFKNNLQGELAEDGRLEHARQLGWNPSAEFTSVLTDLANRNMKGEHWDGADKDLRFKLAVEYLIRARVCLVIDNHETIARDDEEHSLDKLLRSFTEHPGFVESKSKIIITTRIRPRNRTGEVYRIPYLDFQEMRDLARNRVRWLAKQNPTNIQVALHQEGIVDWEGLAKWMQEQFVADIQREILGHPMIVFIVVFKAMMRNDTKKSFQAIIVEMIDNATNADGLSEDTENPLSKLMQYITSLQFGYIQNIDDLHQAIYMLASQHTFSEKDAISTCSQFPDVDYTVVLNELVDLDLISKSRNESSYSFRTEYHSRDIRKFIQEKFNYFGEPSEHEQLRQWVGEKVNELNIYPLSWNTVRHLSFVKVGGENQNEAEWGPPSQALKNRIQLIEEMRLSIEEFDLFIRLADILAFHLSKLDEPPGVLFAEVDGKSEAWANREAYGVFSKRLIEATLQTFTRHLLGQRWSIDQFRQICRLLERIHLEYGLDGMEKSVSLLIGHLSAIAPECTKDSQESLSWLWHSLTRSDPLDWASISRVGGILYGCSGQEMDKQIIAQILKMDWEALEHEKAYVGDMLTPLSVHFSSPDVNLGDLEIQSFFGQFIDEDDVDHPFQIHQGVKLQRIEKIGDEFVGYSTDGATIYHLTWYEKQRLAEPDSILSLVGDHSVDLQVIHRKESVSVDSDEPDVITAFVCSQFRSMESSLKKQKSVDESLEIVDLSRDQMWMQFEKIAFAEINSTLFFVTLAESLRQQGVEHITRGWWKRWRQHHYPDLTTPEVVESLSKGQWMIILGDKPEPFTIRRKASSGSESEMDALTELLETFVNTKNQRTDEFNPFANYTTKISTKSFKKSRNQRFKPIRGNRSKTSIIGSIPQRTLCQECGYSLPESDLKECPQCGIEFKR